MTETAAQRLSKKLAELPTYLPLSAEARDGHIEVMGFGHYLVVGADTVGEILADLDDFDDLHSLDPDDLEDRVVSVIVAYAINGPPVSD